MKTTFGLGALVSALVLGTALVSAPAFAQAEHHHHHHVNRTASEPQTPPQPQPCIHMQTSCP